MLTIIPILPYKVCEIVYDDYEKLKVGDHIRMVYLPDDPHILRIASGARLVESPGIWRGVGYFGIAGAIAFAIIVLVQLSNLHPS